MIARVLAVVLSTAAGSSTSTVDTTAGSAAAAPPALREIVESPSSANMCANVVVHVNAAILTTLRDDAAISHAVAKLKATDFETLGSTRRAAVADIVRTSNDLAENVDRAKSETRRLRDYAVHPAGADRSAEIAAFVDPLDAALDGQRKAADGLAAFVTALEYHDMRESARQAALVRQTDPDDPDTFHSGGRLPTALGTPSGVTMDRGPSPTISARTQASDLETLGTAIAADEARAAVRSESAVGGC